MFSSVFPFVCLFFPPKFVPLPRNEEVEKMMVVVGEESEKTAKVGGFLGESRSEAASLRTPNGFQRSSKTNPFFVASGTFFFFFFSVFSS